MPADCAYSAGGTGPAFEWPIEPHTAIAPSRRFALPTACLLRAYCMPTACLLRACCKHTTNVGDRSSALAIKLTARTLVQRRTRTCTHARARARARTRIRVGTMGWDASPHGVSCGIRVTIVCASMWCTRTSRSRCSIDSCTQASRPPLLGARETSRACRLVPRCDPQ